VKILETNSTDELIKNLSNADVDVRRKASADAQSLFCGSIHENDSKRLLWALAIKLHVEADGTASEPDHYVRERCAGCFRLAAESCIDISTYVPVLSHSKDKDPHEWVKEASEEALNAHEGRCGLEQKKFPAPKKENHAQIRKNADPAPAVLSSQIRKLRVC